MKDLNTTKSMDIGDNEKSYETLDSEPSQVKFTSEEDLESTRKA